MTISERIAKIKIKTCECGARLRGKEIQCRDCKNANDSKAIIR